MARGVLSIVVWLYVICPARYGTAADLGPQISNDKPDLHSGIEGGVTVEPMTDMFVHFTLTSTQGLINFFTCRVHLLAKLRDCSGRILVPGFC